MYKEPPEAPVGAGEMHEHEAKPQITIARVDFSDPRFTEARTAEYHFFLQEEYTGEQPQGYMKEYKHYDRESVFNVAYGPDGEIVGVL